MCGIAGIVGAGLVQDETDRLESMLARLHHRGPDDAGTHVEPDAALGMTRLSIVDISGGHQPMSNEDRSIWVVYNGEIYNHPLLRTQLSDRGHLFGSRCDTEVLVHGYEEWGLDVFERVNGMFAAAIWDRHHRRLVLARDKIGIKPLFYRSTDSELVFASELGAMLSDAQCPRDLDAAGLAAYLSLEFVPAPLTMISGVVALEPGHIVSWSHSAGVDARHYWDVPLGQARSTPAFEAAARELATRLPEVVSAEMVSDVPIGVLLSGGIDSSTVAAMMVRAAGSGQTVQSFSVAFRDADFDESAYARIVARHLGTEHHELVVESDATIDVIPTVIRGLDQPLGDASLLPTYLLSRFAREQVKVVLGGDGGDELFGGYPTLRAHRLARAYGRLPALVGERVLPAIVDQLPTSMGNLSFDFKAKRFVAAAGRPLAERHLTWTGSIDPREVASYLSGPMLESAAGADARFTAERHLGRVAHLPPQDQVLYLDMKLYLEGDILTKVDRASMLNSLEARVPLLNSELVDFVAPLPIAYKSRGRETKRILRQAIRHELPDPIVRRPKRGFALPLARWLRGPLRETIQTTLSRERLEASGLLNPSAVSALLRDHLEGRRDNRKPIWTMFVLQDWWERSLSSGPPIGAAAQRMA